MSNREEDKGCRCLSPFWHPTQKVSHQKNSLDFKILDSHPPSSLQQKGGPNSIHQVLSGTLSGHVVQSFDAVGISFGSKLVINARLTMCTISMAKYSYLIYL